MLIKDYLNWTTSDKFDLEKLRTIFQKTVPFSIETNGSNIPVGVNLVNMQNRLFYTVTQSIKFNGLIGRSGNPDIRKDMPLEELMFLILTHANCNLLNNDFPYYETPNAKATKITPVISNCIKSKSIKSTIIWDENTHDQTLDCKILTPIKTELVLKIPFKINKYGNKQLDI